MPLPDLRSKSIPKPIVKEFDLGDGIKTWMRPLFGIHRDRAESEGRDFAARFVTGGFIHPTTEEYKATPDPLLVDDGGMPVEVKLTFAHAVMIHLIVAMQSPPKSEDPLTVEYIVEMASGKADKAWGLLQDAFNEVWEDGATGKAWGATSDAPPSA
jgi:hypothetical protein